MAVVCLVAIALEGFRSFKIRQHFGVGPTGIAVLRPPLIIRCVSTNIDHGIDRGRSAPTPSPWPIHPASTHVSLWLGFVTVIRGVGLRHQLGIAGRHVNEEIFVFATGFQQKYLIVSICRQAVRQHTASTARSDHNIVSLSFTRCGRHARLCNLFNKPRCTIAKGRAERKGEFGLYASQSPQ